MANKFCGIYKITSPSNRIYIGQSTNILSRINSYKNLRCKTQIRLLNSLKKYGWVKHKFEIIHLCECEELNKLEKYYVDLYGTLNSEYGMNLKDGGGSKGSASYETKQRMSNAMKGDKNPFYGKKHSEETLLKLRGRQMSDETKKILSEQRIGKSNHRKGIPLSDEHKKQISITRIEKKIPSWNEGLKRPEFSDEWKLKMSHSHKGLKHTPQQKEAHRIGLLKWVAKRKNKQA